VIILGARGPVVLGLAVYFLHKAYAPASVDDVAAVHELRRVAPGARSDALFAAYLSRARRYRTGWSVVGWMCGIFLGALFQSRVGWYTLLLSGVGGYLAGAIVAELHHLRRDRSGVRLASLAPRNIADYRSTSQLRFLRVFGALAALEFVLEVLRLHRRTAHGRVAVIVVALVAVMTWVVVEVTQRAIVYRPRPAMPDDLARADDPIRILSVEGLALVGCALIALLLSYSSLVLALTTSAQAAPFGILAYVLFGCSIRFAFRARRMVWPRRKIARDGVPA